MVWFDELRITGRFQIFTSGKGRTRFGLNIWRIGENECVRERQKAQRHELPHQ